MKARPPATLGSSPRVRGRLRFRQQPDGLLGLIPACAGQTHRRTIGQPPKRAHPRVCGADELPRPVSFACAGSSPRVRGRPLSSLSPACAERAHPRVCGADRRSRLRIRRRCGLIPACAGQTEYPDHRRGRVRAHPRVCGVDSVPSSHIGGRVGSSPRVRGRLDSRVDVVAISGLIPACAGQTG